MVQPASVWSPAPDWFDLGLPVAGICGVNQWVEEVHLSWSLSIKGKLKNFKYFSFVCIPHVVVILENICINHHRAFLHPALKH